MRFWGCLLLVALIQGALAGTTGPTETTAGADNRLVSVLRADQVWNAVTTTPEWEDLRRLPASGRHSRHARGGGPPGRLHASLPRRRVERLVARARRRPGVRTLQRHAHRPGRQPLGGRHRHARLRRRRDPGRREDRGDRRGDRQGHPCLSARSVTSGGSAIDDIRFNGGPPTSRRGMPGLIVLDLRSGKARRVLDDDRSTTDERPMYAEARSWWPRGKQVRIHADQLEVSPDGRHLYFQPASGPLYRVDAPAGRSVRRGRAVPPCRDWVHTPSTGGTAIHAEGTSTQRRDAPHPQDHTRPAGHRAPTAWRPRPSGRGGNAERSHMVVSRFLSVGVGRLLGVSRYRLQPSPAQEAALLEHCGHARYVWNLAVEQHAHWQRGAHRRPGLPSSAVSSPRRAPPRSGWPPDRSSSSSRR